MSLLETIYARVCICKHCQYYDFFSVSATGLSMRVLNLYHPYHGRQILENRARCPIMQFWLRNARNTSSRNTRSYFSRKWKLIQKNFVPNFSTYFLACLSTSQLYEYSRPQCRNCRSINMNVLISEPLHKTACFQVLRCSLFRECKIERTVS